jgi:hypothetical protein
LVAPKTRASLSVASRVIEDYAKRGVFRGFSKKAASSCSAAFQMIWHRDRRFDVIVNTRRRTITIPVVLPAVRTEPRLYNDFRVFVQSQQDAGLAQHRRIEPNKVRLLCGKRQGNASLTMVVRDNDYEYALQRLIHLVHSTYLIFLPSGPYRDYMVKELGARSEIG